MSTRSLSRFRAMKALAFFLAGAMSMVLLPFFGGRPFLLMVTQEEFEATEGVVARWVAAGGGAEYGLTRRGCSEMLAVLVG